MFEGAPFYVTLPSDVKSSDENTASDWTTRLKQPITLKGKWEMALVEMQYMNSLYTLPVEQRITVEAVEWYEHWRLDERPVEPKGSGWQKIGKSPAAAAADAIAEEELPSRRAIATKDIVIPAGNYRNADTLLELINTLAPKLAEFPLRVAGATYTELTASNLNDKTIHMKFASPTNRRVILTTASKRIGLRFPPGSSALQKLLGFDTRDFAMPLLKELDLKRKDLPMYGIATTYRGAALNQSKGQSIGETYLAERPVNTHVGNQSLYVYCDIADYSLIGDTAAQFLRSVPIRGEEDTVVEVRYDKPHYVPVIAQHFETIHMILANDLGYNAKFATGKSQVKLHLRPQKFY